MPQVNQIIDALHKGVSAHPPEKLVYNKAGDILTLINHTWAETKRADAAEARLDALEKASKKGPAKEAAETRS